VVWVAALLAAMLSVTQLYAGDLADGSLEQMLVASGPARSTSSAWCWPRPRPTGS
jgi:heme exporter protein B